MKKVFIVVSIFFFCINLFGTEISKKELIGKDNQFQINETFYFIIIYSCLGFRYANK